MPKEQFFAYSGLEEKLNSFPETKMKEIMSRRLCKANLHAGLLVDRKTGTLMGVILDDKVPYDSLSGIRGTVYHMDTGYLNHLQEREYPGWRLSTTNYVRPAEPNAVIGMYTKVFETDINGLREWLGDAVKYYDLDTFYLKDGELVDPSLEPLEMLLV